MADSGRKEKDLALVEEFETVRAVTADGRSVQVPKSKFGGNLEVASANVLGGIKAEPKEATDTNEVKIDPATGKLYCPPSEVAVATASKVGGIVAEPKTSEETQEVKIDSSTGKLYAPKGQGNPPDEEDITLAEINGVQKLQFNDKRFIASSYSGLGRKYLRKNIVNGKNVLTQAMLSQSNTRYIIQYEYDLNGAAVTVPAGCVLEFQGGSLSNGTIVGNSTKFKNLIDDTLLCDFGGTFKDMSIKASYLGLHPEGDGYVGTTSNQMDKFLRLNNLICKTNTIIVEFEHGYYGFGGGDRTAQLKSMSVSQVWNGWYPICIEAKNNAVTKNLTIKGNGAKFVNVFGYYVGGWYLNNGVITPTAQATAGWENNTYGGGCIFINKEDLNVCFDGLYVDLKEQDTLRYGSRSKYSANTCPVYIRACNDCYIKNSYMANSPFECLLLSKADNIVIENSTFNTGRRHNIAFAQYNTCKLLNIRTINGGNPRVIENATYRFEHSGHDIDFEGEFVGSYAFGDLYIDGHTSIDPSKGVYISGSYIHKNIEIKNLTVRTTRAPMYYKSNDTNEIVKLGIQRASILYASGVFNVSNVYVQDKIPTFGSIRRPDVGNQEGKEWLYETPATPIMADNIVYESKHVEGTVDLQVEMALADPFNYKWDSSENDWEYVSLRKKSDFEASGAPCFNVCCFYNNLTLKLNDTITYGNVKSNEYSSVKINNLIIHNIDPKRNTTIVKRDNSYGDVENLTILDCCQGKVPASELRDIVLYGVARNIKLSKSGKYYTFKLEKTILGEHDYLSYPELEGDYVKDNILFYGYENVCNSRIRIGGGGYSCGYLGNTHSNISKKTDYDNTVGINSDFLNSQSSLVAGRSIALFKGMKNTGVDEEGNFTYRTYYAGNAKGLPQNIYNTIGDIEGYPLTGECVYVVEKGKPIWWNGSAWIDSNGTQQG